jgi:hypothetical protein
VNTLSLFTLSFYFVFFLDKGKEKGKAKVPLEANKGAVASRKRKAALPLRETASKRIGKTENKE